MGTGQPTTGPFLMTPDPAELERIQRHLPPDGLLELAKAKCAEADRIQEQIVILRAEIAALERVARDRGLETNDPF